MSIQLEWKYHPAKYFEEPISWSYKNIELQIDNGTAIASIEPDIYHLSPSIKEDLTKVIENRFFAVQIMNYKEFNLEKSTRTDFTEDGKKNYFLEADSCLLKMTVNPVDLIVKDKDGTVISDTKRDRLNRQENFSNLVDEYRSNDITLDHIRKSYQKSVKNPDDELVHLYEIKDSLSKRFGSKSVTVKKLGIKNREWGKIGVLANTLPLK
ncbi:MAG: hypothetical protein AAF609_17250 [Cyanobacteria bacterium P01_C01_bin.120]